MADKERHVQVELATTQTAALKEVEDLSEIPCVKAFRDHAIPSGSRHDTAAKNLAILYWQAKGTWEGFEAWAEELAENKPEFTAKNITDWKSWFEGEQRELNCAELRGFIKAYIVDFSCEGCPLKAAHVAAEKRKKGVNLGDYRLKQKGSTVIVVDRNGEPLWSAKLASLTGLQTKRDLAKKLKLEEDLVDRAVAKFMVQVAAEKPEPKTWGREARPDRRRR